MNLRKLQGTLLGLGGSGFIVGFLFLAVGLNIDDIKMYDIGVVMALSGIVVGVSGMVVSGIRERKEKKNK